VKEPVQEILPDLLRRQLFPFRQSGTLCARRDRLALTFHERFQQPIRSIVETVRSRQALLWVREISLDPRRSVSEPS
jgi:hypothetical protein